MMKFSPIKRMRQIVPLRDYCETHNLIFDYELNENEKTEYELIKNHHQVIRIYKQF